MTFVGSFEELFFDNSFYDQVVFSCMMYSFSKRDQKAAIRTLAALAVNLSAGWFGLVLIVPNFWPVSGFRELWLLTVDLMAGILFLWISYQLERRLV